MLRSLKTTMKANIDNCVCIVVDGHGVPCVRRIGYWVKLNTHI